MCSIRDKYMGGLAIDTVVQTYFSLKAKWHWTSENAIFILSLHIYKQNKVKENPTHLHSQRLSPTPLHI